MGYVVAAVVLVWVITGVNLLLTVGIIRRLRQHATRLASLAGSLPLPASVAPEVGDRVALFTTWAVDGNEISTADLCEDHLVVFASLGCEPCEELLPELATRLSGPGTESSAAQGGAFSTVAPERTLVVIVGAASETTETIEQLGGLATVVREDPGSGQVQAAFGVAAYPTVVTVAGGLVASVGTRLPERPTAQAPAGAPSLLP